MKKLILMSALFLGVFGYAQAVCVTLMQGNGIEYNYQETVYGYSGSGGEITSVSDPLIYGQISAGSGGFATVTVDVDTDFAMDMYNCGTLPNNDDFYVELF